MVGSPSFGRASVADLRAGLSTIDEAATAARRDPSAIRQVLNIDGSITASGPGERTEPPRSVGQIDGLAGPASWLELLGGLAEIGFDAFVFWPMEPRAEQVELLATEVAPILRARG